jgi:hypothetical protein
MPRSPQQSFSSRFSHQNSLPCMPHFLNCILCYTGLMYVSIPVCLTLCVWNGLLQSSLILLLHTFYLCHPMSIFEFCILVNRHFLNIFTCSEVVILTSYLVQICNLFFAITLRTSPVNISPLLKQIHRNMSFLCYWLLQ